MSDRTQMFCDLSIHSCNNGIFWNSGIWVGTSLRMDGSWDFCLLGLLVGNNLWRLLYLPIHQWKLLLQQVWNSVMICYYHVLCKQHDCLQVRYLWDQKTFPNKSNTYFHNRVCKQLFLWWSFVILGQEIVALLAEPIVRLITVDTHSCHQYLLPMLHRSNGKNLSTKETIAVSQDCPKFPGSPVNYCSQRVNI